MHEMTTSVPIIVGKHVASNSACVCCQQSTSDSIFLLGQMMLCDMLLCKFLNFYWTKVISDGETNEMLIHQLSLNKKGTYICQSYGDVMLTVLWCIAGSQHAGPLPAAR